MHRTIITLLGLCLFIKATGQEVTEKELDAKKALKESTNITYDANQELIKNDFIEAEADYRRAISKSGENVVAPYNLGRAYYNREDFAEAFSRFKEAGEKAEEKPTKHKAFHNMGNVFMQNKEYQKAVEAYKQALRSNPDDDETRYNLALAKEMLKNDQNNQNNDDNKDDKNDQNKDNKEQNQDQNNEGDQDKDKEGDQKDDQNKDQGDEGDKGDQDPEENKKGDGDEKQEQKKQPNQGEEPEKKPRPRPNQLSKQQIQNLLEAMQNEEKKVQEKIDAKKVKGKKIKNEKDW